VKEQAHQHIAEVAAALAGRVLSRDELEEALYALVRDCVTPGARPQSDPARRSPIAGEVLPPHQRASWAREKTPYDDL